MTNVSTLRVLRAVEQRQQAGSGASIRDVAEYLAVEHSTASRLVTSAVEAGLLTKTSAGDDQRRRELVLTDVACNALATVTDRRRELVAETVADWPDETSTRWSPFWTGWPSASSARRQMTAEVIAPPQSRGAFGLMFDPVFGALFWGKMFAVVAVWTHSIVAAIVMYDATHSALMVGLVGVVQFGPQLILSPTSGKWADTGNPARQILLGRVLCVVGSGSVAAWLFVESGTARACRLRYRCSSGRCWSGSGSSSEGRRCSRSCRTSFGEGELSTAMALNSIPMTIGRIVGPVSGAYLAAHLGSAAGFAVAAALHLVFAIVLVVVRFPSPPPRLRGYGLPRARPPSSTSGGTARCCWRCSR